MRTGKIRVLHVVGAMNRGGAESFIMNAYRAADRTAVQFDFAVEAEEPSHFDDEIRSLGGRIFPHPKPAVAGFRAYGETLRRTLTVSGPFAAVHSHVYQFSGYVLRAAEAAGVPVRLAHSHTTSDGQRPAWRRLAYRRLMRWLIFRHSTHLLGCSRPACQALYGASCWADSRVRVVPNAISLDSYSHSDEHRSAARDALSIPRHARIVGHVGRFDGMKNHAFLVEVFAAWSSSAPDAYLVLVGDGPLRREVEDLVQAAGLKSAVRFLGIRADVPNVLSALDAFVFPSAYEGLGLAVVEAQAAGIPCVVSDAVPREADMGMGLVTFAPLQSGPANWSGLVQSALLAKRPEWATRRTAIRAAGYDILEVSRELEQAYTNAPE